MPMSQAIAPRGLEGVVATTSGICWIDGDAGVLSYRGIDIHELAAKSTFEETTYLLWFGKLPNTAELKDFTAQLAASRTMDAMIVAYFDRIRKGKDIVEPDTSLSHAGNFLWMLTGEKPIAEAEHALDVALVLHADHELNASTFAARVIAATLSDVHSAITGAIGALKGPLHGGANEAVMKLLYEIDAAGADPVEYVRGLLTNKVKISGFGHRVYKTEDPRATHLRRMSKDLGTAAGNARWYEMSEKIEGFVKGEKKLNANVDFYSASTYTTLGIDIDLFTPIFAVSRISGWAAHVIEQHDNNRLIRPRADYTGPAYPAPYVPLQDR